MKRFFKIAGFTSMITKYITKAGHNHGMKGRTCKNIFQILMKHVSFFFKISKQNISNMYKINTVENSSLHTHQDDMK